MALLDKLRGLKEKVIDVAMNYTPIEVKVREATNGDEPWGPHGTLMAEIAQATYNYDEYKEAMDMVWRRTLLDIEGKAWRRIYKGLLLLGYLLRNGSERVVDVTIEYLAEIKRLERFEYIDPKGKNEGINVSKAAKDIVELVRDTDRLRDERKKAKANKGKYVGIGNPDYSGGGGDFSDMGGKDSSRTGRKFHDDDDGDYRRRASGYRDDFNEAPRYEDDESHSSGSHSHTENVSSHKPSSYAPSKPSPQPVRASKPAHSANLIDFDFSSPSPQTHTQQTSSTAQNNNGGGSFFANFSNDDDFNPRGNGSNVVSAPKPSNPTPMSTQQPSGDIFGDFTSAAPIKPQSTTLLDDGFGDFTSAPASDKPKTFFTSAPLIPSSNSTSNTQPPMTHSVPSGGNNKPTAWDGLNIDLSNLNVTPPKKPTTTANTSMPSMPMMGQPVYGGQPMMMGGQPMPMMGGQPMPMMGGQPMPMYGGQPMPMYGGQPMYGQNVNMGMGMMPQQGQPQMMMMGGQPMMMQPPQQQSQQMGTNNPQIAQFNFPSPFVMGGGKR